MTFSICETAVDAYAVLKKSGVAPEEVQLLKEIDAARRELAGRADPAGRESLSRRLAELTLKYRLLVERRTGRRTAE